MKASPEVIVHAACRHLPQGQNNHVERLLRFASLSLVRVIAGQKVEGDWMRKFWCITEASLDRIENPGELLIPGIQRWCSEIFCNIGISQLGLAQGLHDLFTRAGDLLVILTPGSRDSFQNLF